MSQISLQGWDTANVVDVDVLNAAIVAAGSTPPKFALTEGPLAIEGAWASWSVVPGGSGQNLHMECPIASGAATKEDGSKLDLAGAKVRIEVKLKQLPDPAVAFEDPSAAGGATGAPTAIVADPAGTEDDPPVVIISVTPRTLRNPFQFLFEDWFNANLAQFNHVFHAVMLNERAAQGDFQWLKPTAVSYAVADTVDGKTTAFAVLSETDGDSDAKLAHQIDPNALSALPDGANSVFVISGEKLSEHVLMRGAQQVMSGSELADFELQGNGLVVTNKRELVWRALKLESGKVVSPTVPKGGFKTRVVQDQIELEFTGLTFDDPSWWLPGREIVTINYRQYFFLELLKKPDGTFVLFPTSKDPAVKDAKEVPDLDSYTINVTLDADARDFEQTMGIIAIAASILPLGSALFKGGRWALQAGSRLAESAMSAWNAGGRALSVVVDAAEIAALADDELIATDNLAAAAALARGVEAPAAGLGTLINRFAMGSGLIAAVTGSLAAIAKLEHIADSKLDDVPSIDTFLENALGASRWPRTAGWQMKDARLAQSLLLYGALTGGA